MAATTQRRLWLVIAVAAALLAGMQAARHFIRVDTGQAPPDDRRLLAAIRNGQSNVQVEGSGTVVRVLADDTRGRRHQRFILRIASGQTLLVAHNIDLSPRIDRLRAGDTVLFYGEYEWNAKGGVVHWTHRDPSGRHPDGWLKHEGRVYR